MMRYWKPFSLLVVALFLQSIGDDSSHASGSKKKGKFPGKVVEAVSDRGREGKDYVAEPYAGSSYNISLADAPVSKAVLEQPKPPTTTPLSARQVDQLLRRLPQMEAAEARDFAFRKKSLKRPKAGSDVKTPFPPKVKRPRPMSSVVKVKKDPLKVVRHYPQGVVGHIPKVSLSFSAPMVPLSSLEEVHNLKIPATLSPSHPGKWSWLDTQTLQFIPKKPFPLSSRYRIVVKAGTRSAVENVLKKKFSFSFETPRNRYTYGQPSGKQTGLRPTITVGFAQPLLKQDVLRLVKVTANRSYAVRLAKKQPQQPDKTHGGVTQVALELKKELPKNTRVKVTIRKGIPSVHGPLKSQTGGKFGFSTYPPFTVTNARCASYQCRPNKNTTFALYLSNPMAEKSFDERKVAVKPKLANMRIAGQGTQITVMGDPEPKTTYTVTLSKKLKDRWNQFLTKKRAHSFTTTVIPKPLKPPPPKPPKPRPWLSPTHHRMFVMDPDAPRTYKVKSRNHKQLAVEIYQVEPVDWFKYQEEFVARFWHWKKEIRPTARMPGKKVHEQIIRIDAGLNEEKEIEIDLKKGLNRGIGQIVLLVKGADNDRSHAVWVQATKIGITAWVDQDSLTTYISKLKGGLPISGARVTLFARSGAKVKPKKGQTDRTGLSTFSFFPNTALLSAKKGRDVAFIPRSVFGSTKPERQHRFLWYVIDDRKLYRPNETVLIKGWVRTLDLGKGGDLSLPPKSARKIRYQLRDARWNELAKGELELNRLGGFNLEFALPDNINLGQATLSLSVVSVPRNHQSANHNHPFKVQEFRRPEFEVDIVPDEPYVMNKEIVVPVRARYYSGGPLPFAPTSWQVNATSSTFVPPNMSDYKFGRSPPSWYGWWGGYGGYGHRRGYRGRSRRHHYDDGLSLRPVQGSRSGTFASKTGKYGVHRLKIDLKGALPPWPISISLQAAVEDVNRQKWVANNSIQVHPADAYLGLRTVRSFVQAGDPIFLDTIVSSLTGKAKSGHFVDIRGFTITKKNDKERGWHQVMRGTERCQFTSESRPVRCVFHTKGGGNYVLRGIIRDKRERILSSTEVMVWVAGPQPSTSDKSLTQERVFLLADKDSYAPGEVAELLVQTPFVPAEGVLTVRRSGIIEKRRFSMRKLTTTLPIRIKDGHIPGLGIQVDLFGGAKRMDAKGKPVQKPNSAPTRSTSKLPKRPAYANGSTNLKVTPDTRVLQVRPIPAQKALEPGSRTTIAVEVKDANNRPVKGAEVVLMAADESVLALAGYQLPDPMAPFFPSRSGYAHTVYSRQQLILTGKPKLQAPSDPSTGTGAGAGGGLDDAFADVAGVAAEAESAPSMARSAKRSAPRRAKPAAAPSGGRAQKKPAKKVKMRKEFGALLVFEPELKTDARGRTVVKVKLPDTLTRYRIMAVAVDGAKRYGKGESTIRARKKLMVRPSPPRFLNFGDHAELPIVVQNLTEKRAVVKVALRASNARLTKVRGLSVDVPPEDRVELRFPLETERPGRAKIQVIAASGRLTDAAEFKLPVWSPVTSEAFAVYGTIDEGAILQQVKAPKDATSLFGGLEITTSATALAELTDAFLYLVSYPYDCSEQIASRLLGVVSLKDVLGAFEAPGLPSPDLLLQHVQQDLVMLQKRQNSDGGWDYWRYDSVPYVSIHTAHAVIRADLKGFKPDANMKSRALSYLRNIENGIRNYESRHRFKFDRKTRAALKAYAAYVRAVSGDNATSNAKRIYKSNGLKKISLETAGWLMAVFARGGAKKEAAAISRYLQNRVEETASRAHFVTRYEKGSHWLLHSARRSDAVILDALISAEKDNTLIPKIVRGLLAHRLKGRWRNTQENVFVLVALEHYFSAFESVTPNFVARVWLGEDYAGEQAYRGRTSERQHLTIPMSFVKQGGLTKELLLDKEGAGRLYYRVGMQYAPTDLQLDPLDRGFVVKRTYEAVDDQKDVERKKDGTWKVRAGSMVRVTITMQAPSNRYHVALVDRLPAGFEPLNPALAGTTGVGFQAARRQRGGYWYSTHWFRHQNLRDERAEAFTSQLWPGSFTYTYLARATTPGTFIAPPAMAEEMYTPETFGRSKSEVVVVQ